MFCWFYKQGKPACICVMIFTKIHHKQLNMLYFFPGKSTEEPSICNELEFPGLKDILCLSQQRKPFAPHRSHDPVPVSVRDFGWSSTAAETHKVLSFSDGLAPKRRNQSISLSKAALKCTLTLNELQGLRVRSNYHFTDSS